MTEINIIPKPTYQKVEPGKTNLLSIKKIITKTNNISEIEIAKMVQQLINPINNIEIETSQSKESNAISILLITDNKNSKDTSGMNLTQLGLVGGILATGTILCIFGARYMLSRN